MARPARAWHGLMRIMRALVRVRARVHPRPCACSHARVCAPQMGVDLEAVTSFERLLARDGGGGRAASASGLTAPSSRRSSSTASSDRGDAMRRLRRRGGTGERLAACAVGAGALLSACCDACVPRLAALRYLLPVYALAAMLAPINIAVPALLLPLDEAQDDQWSEGVLTALWCDLLLVQPALQLVRALVSEAVVRASGRRHRDPARLGHDAS